MAGLVGKLGALLEAVVKGAPLALAAVHLSVPVQLLQLEDRTCTTATFLLCAPDPI